jgi:hypothetical protein
VANEHNALHVRVDLLVVEVLDDLVKNVEGGDISLVGVRVLVVAASGPLRTAPDESTGVGATASLLVRVPWVSKLLVGTTGEVRCENRDGVTVDFGVVGCCSVKRVQALCFISKSARVDAFVLAHARRSGSPMDREGDRE